MRNLTEIRISGFGGQGVILIEQELVRIDKLPAGVRFTAFRRQGLPKNWATAW